MKTITLEVPDGVISVNATVKYKKKDQFSDNQYCMSLIEIDTDKFSGARVDEEGNFAFMIRMEKSNDRKVD